MAAFRFRAAVVLDLRLKEEQSAKTALSLAEARFHEAKRLLAEEEARRELAQRELGALERRGSDLGTLLWHRNWIVRLAGSVAALARDLDVRARETREAALHWQKAREKRLVLERMRDRAWRRFQIEEARREQKAMDELARVRYVMSDSWRSEA